jgi:hypothetical protein
MTRNSSSSSSSNDPEDGGASSSENLLHIYKPHSFSSRKIVT